MRQHGARGYLAVRALAQHWVMGSRGIRHGRLGQVYQVYQAHQARLADGGGGGWERESKAEGSSVHLQLWRADSQSQAEKGGRRGVATCDGDCT